MLQSQTYACIMHVHSFLQGCIDGKLVAAAACCTEEHHVSASYMCVSRALTTRHRTGRALMLAKEQAGDASFELVEEDVVRLLSALCCMLYADTLPPFCRQLSPLPSQAGGQLKGKSSVRLSQMILR